MGTTVTTTAGPGRPDTWVEALSATGKSDDPMSGLAETLACHAADLGVRAPRVLLGHRTGAAALDSLRAATGMALTGLDSFALAGDEVGGKPLGFPDAEAWRAADGILCLDAEPYAYLNAVQFCFDNGIDIPVLADVDTIPGQFCQLSVATGGPETDVYIYNYFTKLYRLKDPLQLVWTCYWTDGTATHGTRLLGPNGNLHLTPADLSPPAAKIAGTLVYGAHNPAFARVPNSRFRGVVDVVGETYCATLHGDELEAKRADEGRWFDTHVAPLGGGHDIRLVMRNDIRQRGPVRLSLTATPANGGSALEASVDLPPEALEREVSVAELVGAGDEPVSTELVATVEGRSVRLEWKETWAGPTGRACFQSNHGSTNGTGMLELVGAGAATDEPDPVLFANIERLAANGVLPLPYPMPVLPAGDRYRFSFSAGKFLPHLDYLHVAAFDRAGRYLGRERVALPANLGYLGVEDTPFADALAAEGGMLLISPPYVEKRLVAYQNCREDLWIRMTDTVSGDSDISEFQLHNRNLRGYTVPIGFGQSPQMIKSRTEMMIRFRRDDRFDTRLLLINASPELKFDRTGDVELEFNLPDGRAAARTVTLAPQTWQLASVDDLLPPDVADAPFGWVRVVSDRLALSAYAALVDRTGGGLGFQHLWGA